MKKILFVLLFIQLKSIAQKADYWQQYLHYSIEVSLNDKEKSITGFEKIVYTNNSPETLDFIWFHIYPNAYKNKNTALFQQLENDKERKKESVKYGYIDGLSFSVDGKAAKTKPHKDHIDIIKLILPEPLMPGKSITIATPFKVYLPSYFSRSGYADNEFMICQWYPKPAVYDKDGWHEMPYLDMGEFYSEYATYNVSITVPADYIVAATGNMLTTHEKEMYKKLGTANVANKLESPQLYKPLNNNATKTLVYHQDSVPDFAWFADKDFVIQYDTLQLNSGKIIDVFTYYHNKRKTVWNNSIDFVKDATKAYSNWIGEYAYSIVQAVEGPKNNASGGMEYPTITLITSPNADSKILDAVIAHEVGHNWFMSMLGSNERKHAWQDEGLNSYYEFRYEAEKYRTNSMLGDFFPKKYKELSADEFLDNVYNMFQNFFPLNEIIDKPSDEFTTSMAYGITSYVKAAIWMHAIEKTIGKEMVDKAFQLYFSKWKFKHPQPNDLQAAFEQVTGKKFNKTFLLLKQEGAINFR